MWTVMYKVDGEWEISNEWVLEAQAQQEAEHLQSKGYQTTVTWID